MAGAYLKAKIYAAASVYAPLTSLLGAPPNMRWYDTQLRQGSLFPAVVVQIVSNPQSYAFQAPLPTSFARVQFTVWAQPDSVAADNVADALYSFFADFNAYLPAGSKPLPYYANLVVGDREALVPKLEPPVFQRIIDVQMFNNSTV